jgi:hypothetical protein
MTMRLSYPNTIDLGCPRKIKARWPAGVALIDTDAAEATLAGEPCRRAVYLRAPATMTLALTGATRLEVRAGLPLDDPSLLADDLRAVARDLGLEDGGRKSTVLRRILNHLGGA